MKDERLLQGLRSGDEAAYRTAFLEYYPLLLGFAYKILRQEDHSKDVVQNVFAKIFALRKNISVQQDLRSYLLAAVRNECLNLIKKEKRILEHHQEFAKGIDDTVVTNAIEDTEDELRIYRAINDLPAQCQKIFTMSRLDNKNNHEIAAELGLSVRTVETQISNALKTLRKTLLQLFFF